MNNLTLSITTIGDLLLENRITRNKDGKSIDNVRLTIPEYQRPYKWTVRNAIQGDEGIDVSEYALGAVFDVFTDRKAKQAQEDAYQQQAEHLLWQ